MKKELLTKEKILKDYKSYFSFDKTNLMILIPAYALLTVCIALIIKLIISTSILPAQILAWFTLIFLLLWAVYFIAVPLENFIIYNRLKNNNYRITTDNVIGFVRNTDDLANIWKRHGRNRLCFKQYGDYYIPRKYGFNYSYLSPADYDSNFELSKTMDEFYVVLYKERILLAYNKKFFTLDEVK